MNPLAKMGIPNLAEYGRRSQECPSQCKLAMSLSQYRTITSCRIRGHRAAVPSILAVLPPRFTPRPISPAGPQIRLVILPLPTRVL
jgi:hypothetical protein